MKTAKIKIVDHKNTSIEELAYSLLFPKFEKDNPNLEDDDLHDKFYKEVISKWFDYGEYISLEVEIDENFNIIGGKIIKTGK